MNLYRGNKVVFLWFGTYKVGYIQSIFKNKIAKKVYYTYNIRGEDDKTYENIPLLSNNSRLGINLSLTKKMGGKNE